MTMVTKFTIEAHEWPGRGDLAEFVHHSNAKEEIQDYLTQEFDTLVSFRLDDLDVLAGYTDAYFLPLHAFARSLSAGMKQLVETGEASFPLYLQQYEVSEGDPAHMMTWSRKDNAVQVGLQWVGDVTPPAHLAALADVTIDYEMFRREVVRFLDFYAKKIALLLGPLADWSGDQIATLFDGF